MKSISPEEKTAETRQARKVAKLFEERGKKAFEKAHEAILSLEIAHQPLCEALRYFIEEVWYGVKYPGLISLTCEAVGGKEEDTVRIGAAMVLLGGAVDIHDDIIDNSKTKGSKTTVFGKFGKDLALLAGDVLLAKGLILLHEACQHLPEEKAKAVMHLTEEAFLELGTAEAKEVNLRGKLDLPLSEYFDVIKMKASVTEAYARIGAIVGGGTQDEVKALGQYGRTLGTLATIREDFIDIFEPEELKNRFTNECLPLPLIYAFEDKRIKDLTIRILKKEEITENDSHSIAETIWETKQVQTLRNEMQRLIHESLVAVDFVKNKSLHAKLSGALRILVEGLE